MTLTQLEQRTKNYERMEIEGKMVWVPNPVRIPQWPFVGRETLIEKGLAAWARFDGMLPLHYRLYGPPGTGKNAIIYEIARILKKELYIIQGHQELGPEDVACSATMTSKSTIEYVASPLWAAAYRGGICLFDEIGKAPQAALDPLASLLDDRRTITSVLAGLQLKAHDEFLFCAILNEDEEEGVGLPGFIDERTRPAIRVGYPPLVELEQILNSRLPMLDGKWRKAFLSEFKNETLSPRIAIILLDNAYRMYRRKHGNKLPMEDEVVYYLNIAYEDNVKEGREKEKEEESKKEPKKAAGKLFYN
ncbi:MAG: hypothetical protein A2Y62_09180 [Candidatus Fischerbacteria bacterium RBG_13_37_8]|uniref:ATPase dynein-related AAA domain-containing protein n=1 Tax=Candidatus Fischerbacteria bacterium RBG_13_37_8 TaxID=1817863 RepID=A0A1F5VK66_9BACT|nr:MAG: hypothetical protein A2Y62_09180 [Candidatus Fischerbacteria bacterium RBG_13_37_8]